MNEEPKEQFKSEINFENNILMKKEFNEAIVEDRVEIAVETNVEENNSNAVQQFVKNEEKKGPKKRQLKQTKINIANAKSEKYYKQFDFFFNRSCFRIMTEFFKDKFNEFYAER